MQLLFLILVLILLILYIIFQRGGMIRSYLFGWKNSFNYSKRTNRKTFFQFFFIDIFFLLPSLLLFANTNDGSDINQLKQMVLFFFFTPYNVIATFPRLSICARRIKDTGKSTNWMLFLFIPTVGWLILLIIFLQESMPDSQKTLEQTIPIKLIRNESDQNESSNNIASKIEELNSLKAKGMISEEEYEKMRKNILGL